MPKLPVPGPLKRPSKPGRSGANGYKNGNGDGNGRDQALHAAKEAGADVAGWVDERTGATGFLTGMLFRKVPKAPTGSTRSARRRCSRSSCRP